MTDKERELLLLIAEYVSVLMNRDIGTVHGAKARLEEFDIAVQAVVEE